MRSGGRRSLGRRTLLAGAALLLALALPGRAQAALKAAGPLDAVTTIPGYYQDANDLALQPCLDQNNLCVLTPLFDPAVTNPPSPITTTGPITSTNFPDEIFYFLADNLITTPTGVKLKWRAALEAAFLAGVVPNAGITFLRINFVATTSANLAPNSVYTVTHPYGTFTFSTDAAGDAISTQGNHITFRTEDPVAASPGIYFPPDMQAGTNTHIGPWLMRSAGLLVDPVSGHTYVGDPAVATTVTGSPFGTNSVTVTGPNIGGPGVNSISQNLFTVSGRVFTGKIPTPLALDRVTYSRNSAGGHVDAFVTTSPASSVNISGTGIATTPLAQNVPGTGKFFATVPFTPSSTLPTSIVVTNLSDLPTPTPYPVTLVDDVAITQADYNTVTKTLTVKASSTDQLPPAPTLTLESLAAPVTLDATGTAAVNLGTTIPPLEVVVNSSKGGSEFAPVRVVTPGPAPLAVNDAATTAAATPVVVNVLANDTVLAPNTIDPTTVTIGTTAGGTAVVNPTNGSVTYTPAVGFSGPGSFTYSVKDNFGQVSNLATVAVTVAAPPPPPPLPTSVLVTPNIASPQLPNVPITFLAGATGGSGSYQYQWSIKAGGQTTYTVVAPYGSSNSWIWTPTLTGAYDIQVDVRNAGSTAATEAHGNFLFYQIETPATAVVLAASPAATQVVANPVVFTATASGGSGPFEYRFWLNDGTAYFVVQDWNTVNSWTWTPGKTGIHDVFVEVRRFGTQDFRDAFAVLLAYQITP